MIRGVANTQHLDPALSYAVRRSEEYENTSLVRRIDNDRFEPLSERGVWLPHTSTLDAFRNQQDPTKYREKSTAHQVCEVVELSLQPVPDTQFDLLSGKLAAAQFQSPDATAPAPPNVLKHVASVDSTGMPASAGRWVIATGAFAIAVLLALLGIRRYRQSVT